MMVALRGKTLIPGFQLWIIVDVTFAPFST
ncbi:MAG: hypothetical protein BWX50_01367 [Euryarchaeota archaeon ADurb.Bin009]|nr:MAG: hypothetical protein BWX50_01367 [Euryarchaeota archaeon ADurb.Bin009]